MQNTGILRCLKNRELQIREIQNSKLQGLPVLHLSIENHCGKPCLYYRLVLTRDLQKDKEMLAKNIEK